MFYLMHFLENYIPLDLCLLNEYVLIKIQKSRRILKEFQTSTPPHIKKTIITFLYISFQTLRIF